MGGALTRMLGRSSLGTLAYDKISAYLASNTAFSTGKITVDTTAFDTGSIWNAANKRIIPTRSGYYLFGAREKANIKATLAVQLGVNGSAAIALAAPDNQANDTANGGCALYSANGSTDYFELFAFHASSQTILGGSADTYLNAVGPFNTPSYQPASAYLGSAQSGTGSVAKLNLSVANFDPASIFDSTNKRFLPTVAGYYVIMGRARCGSLAVPELYVYKNGSNYKQVGSSGTLQAQAGTTVVFLNGSTDYVEIYAKVTNTVAITTGSFESWAAIVGPMPTAAGSYFAGSASSTTGGNQKMAQDTVDFDPNGWWDAGNTRFVPTRAGYYFCNMRCEMASANTLGLLIAKNGGVYQALGAIDGSSPVLQARSGSGGLVFLNGSTDYVEPWIFTNNARAFNTGSATTWFNMVGPF